MDHTIFLMKCLFVLIIFSTTFSISHANHENPTFHQILNITHQWRTHHAGAQLLYDTSDMKPSVPFLIAGILTFIAAAISSAGGTGGGGLFIPILTIVAGLDLKLASGFSAFMVTGGSIANVACYMFGRGGLINYDLALLSEPCMLLGVSIGVICNRVLPEWLITVFFALFLGFSTFKTLKSGVRYWKVETQRGSRSGSMPLLIKEVDESRVLDIPWMKVGVLVLIWFSFTLVYLLRGNRYGQGIIHIKSCGKVYWVISSTQIPLAIIFTAWILHRRKRGVKNDDSFQQVNGGDRNSQSSENLMFPVMALLAGVLGGVFGVGGGMLISPLLLQMGIEPQVTAATCSFMVFFSSTMSATQYLMLGMEHINGALTYAFICFVASLVGLILIQRAIIKHGRASLIVFSVGTVMALSTLLITGFGAVDVWMDYTSAKSMGFKHPC
ncbi:hypothetical protein BUALT_Bualt02G0066900 [Buddleja alternifolia]|uniref:Sulfite exporter TauE/SafE family protein n=1 Tax=Buddleja alternifolia TaxID=168488 RepID=A0AAV6Y538_9LAMI|nr:hypothetical protein BUALT_Bualt02G0066900 [Buddleja alternifolia]